MDYAFWTFPCSKNLALVDPVQGERSGMRPDAIEASPNYFFAA